MTHICPQVFEHKWTIIVITVLIVIYHFINHKFQSPLRSFNGTCNWLEQCPIDYKMRKIQTTAITAPNAYLDCSSLGWLKSFEVQLSKVIILWDKKMWNKLCRNYKGCLKLAVVEQIEKGRAKPLKSWGELFALLEIATVKPLASSFHHRHRRPVVVQPRLMSFSCFDPSLSSVGGRIS